MSGTDKPADAKASEQGTSSKVLGTFTRTPGPESGPDCLVCAELLFDKRANLVSGTDKPVDAKVSAGPPTRMWHT